MTAIEKLRTLLHAVVPGNHFYTARLPSVEIRDLDEFRRVVPFTFKHELAEDQTKNPPYGSNLTFPIERYTRFCQTSGTTGTPMRWLDTPESWAWMLDCWTHVYQSAGVTAHDRIF